MAKAPNYISPKGFERLRTELKTLLYEERPELVKTVQWAASLGDRSENADYIYGKKKLRAVDRRIHFLQQRLEKAEIVDPKEQKGTKIQFGATVTLEDEDGESSIFQILGIDESVPEEGKISWISPMAKALLGKSEGDEIILRRPKGVISYEVTLVEYK